MNETCPACGRQCGRYDMCSHRAPEYRHRVCLACCGEAHQTPEDKEVPAWAR